MNYLLLTYLSTFSVFSALFIFLFFGIFHIFSPNMFPQFLEFPAFSASSGYFRFFSDVYSYNVCVINILCISHSLRLLHIPYILGIPCNFLSCIFDIPFFFSIRLPLNFPHSPHVLHSPQSLHSRIICLLRNLPILIFFFVLLVSFGFLNSSHSPHPPHFPHLLHHFNCPYSSVLFLSFLFPIRYKVRTERLLGGQTYSQTDRQGGYNTSPSPSEAR